LRLKVGIRKGHAIAVTLNDRIDYFGQDANIAARVQGLAGVDEVCISQAVMAAPGVVRVGASERQRPEDGNPSNRDLVGAITSGRHAAASMFQK
jgi:class 3 adenylate cyclase